MKVMSAVGLGWLSSVTSVTLDNSKEQKLEKQFCTAFYSRCFPSVNTGIMKQLKRRMQYMYMTNKPMRSTDGVHVLRA